MFEFLSHVPIWVGFLFMFLVYRGLVALKTREVSPVRLMVVPVAFMIWSLVGFLSGPALSALAYPALGAGVVVGLFAGMAVTLASAPTVFVKETGALRVTGSATTLVLVLAVFATKFALASYRITNPDIAQDLAFGLIAAGFSGLTIGLFWGRFGMQLLDAASRSGREIALPRLFRGSAVGHRVGVVLDT